MASSDLRSICQLRRAMNWLCSPEGFLAGTHSRPSEWSSLYSAVLTSLHWSPQDPGVSPAALLDPASVPLPTYRKSARARSALKAKATPRAATVSNSASTFHGPCTGVRTPYPMQDNHSALSRSPFCFETGFAACSLGSSRPLPPPYCALPSTSFSDPLTSPAWSARDAQYRNGRQHLIRGVTNGDDAILAGRNYIGVNDGIGAWKEREHGHAALWARLLLHHWAEAVECQINALAQKGNAGQPDTAQCLQTAYERTLEATSLPTCSWQGTTTSVTALLYHRDKPEQGPQPMLYVTNVGDSQLFVVRPSTRSLIYHTTPQYHSISADCPRQIGTNSTDCPSHDAVTACLPLHADDDIVIATSDGVVDNLWEHEIVTIVLDSLEEYSQRQARRLDGLKAKPHLAKRERGGPLVYIARQLLEAARCVAFDPTAESPYMEKCMDRGELRRGGKADDVSVVVGQCKRRCDA